MGLLDKPWDDTLAGPRCENGLGKLRKNGGTNFAMENPSTPEIKEGLNRLRERRSSAEFQQLNDEARQVTQSITIVKLPVTPQERENPWQSKKKNNNVPGGDQKRGFEKSPRAEPRSPTVYDWVVITSLER